MVVTWLEGDVHRRARRRASRFLQRHYLGMRPAGALVPSLAYYGLVFCKHTPHPGIWGGGVETHFRKFERPPHHRVVERRKARHFRLFLPAFTSCTASRKSSGVSKLR